jgi:hypothetical protein
VRRLVRSTDQAPALSVARHTGVLNHRYRCATLERWRPGDHSPEVITGAIQWQPTPEVSPLRIALDKIFGPEHPQ